MFFLPANQRAIWFEQKLFPQSAIYNVCTYTRIHGEIDVTLFALAIRILIRDNDALRSGIEETGGIPRLFIYPYDPAHAIPFSFLDLSKKKKSEDACLDWMHSQSTLPLDFAHNELCAFSLLKQSDNVYYWYAKLHHTIADGWSASLIVSKLAAVYERLVKGEDDHTETLYSYTDYIRDDENYTASPAFAADEKYWKDRFADAPQPLSAGIRDGKKEELVLSSIRKTMVIDKTFYESIRQLAAANNATTFHVFLGLCYTYFSRACQVSDLVIGVPVMNRYNEAFRQTLGIFVGILPFRMNYAETLTFTELLTSIRDAFRQDFQHQRYPVDEIVRMVKSKEPDLLSLYDISLSFEKQNYNVPFNGFSTTTVALSHQAEKSPLAVFVRECQSADDIKIDFDFNLGHWDACYIDQFLERFRELIHTLVLHPQQVISHVPLATAAETGILLHQPPVTPMAPDTLVTQFEKSVQTWPDHIALEFEDVQLTYATLNAQVNALAHHLRHSFKVKPNEIVAFMVPKSDRAIITILGILKSGAAYLPIDPAYPEERKKFMLEDSGARLLLTESGFELPAFEGQMLLVDQQEYLHENTADPVSVNTSDDTSYIIYTSGSTGKPKGAVIRHAAAVNIVQEYLKGINIQPTENYLQFASLSFDASVLEIFMPLFSGGRLLPVSRDIVADFDRFASFLDKKDIATMVLPPSYLRNLNKASLHKIKALLTAGEPAIPRSELELRDDQGYYNAYGPTECTVCTTIYQETANVNRNVPIGKPIGGMQVYILDQHMQPMPAGMPGEIFIAGIGLAKGYLKNPVLTAEKFIRAPFNPDMLLYRSGDVGRWLSDGNIEYLGRADDQVKIRGHRIEPGEIEAALVLHPSVKNVSVVVKELSRNEKSLHTFVVPQDDVTTDALYAFLRANLPHFMVPDRIMLVNEIPLTINGKVDKRKLLNTVTQEPDREYAAPETKNEKLVARIWQELLAISHISITDNFFQLGGHSLKVGQFINSVYKETGVRLVFSEVFRNPVLREVARLLGTRESVVIPELVKIPERDYYPQSSSQKRLYMLHHVEGTDNSYNIPRAFRVKGNLDRTRLETCFATLIARHDALRTGFEMKDGVPVQIVQKAVPFSIGYTKATPQEQEQLIRSFVRTFDLSTPPLLRAHLFDFGTNNQLFIFDMHHIISDGVSAGLFIGELIQLYNDEIPEPVVFQYKDFAVWQHDLLSADAFKDQESYWLQQFADEAPVLNMQTDYPRPVRKTYEGRRIQAILPEVISQPLEQTGMQLGYTLHQLLLAAFKVLLYKYSGNEDIVVGTPVAGRTRAELDKVQGVFINTLAIRSYPAGKKAFRDFLAEVSQSTLDALKNQDYPFELLIDKLNLRRDASRNPLFDVMFSLLHENRDVLPLGDATLEPLNDICYTSKFDLLLEGVRTGSQLKLNLEYSTELFSDATAERFLQHYVNLLQEINSYLNNTLADINILQPAETQWLLTDCNDTAARYPEDICIHQLFEEQVKLHPDNVALVFEDKQLTYAALDAKATQLAAAIQEAMPANENQVIAVMLDRSPEMI
ncbi:MAG TPA: amino acid adenylation domain-containing protein, partial [Chitinophaga sp.]|uniref:non-ribosomal peptide synthetase n=1 Tax=Chitinophaga sp. TaxID=1869181 RepID=UPI002CBA5718